MGLIPHKMTTTTITRNYGYIDCCAPLSPTPTPTPETNIFEPTHYRAPNEFGSIFNFQRGTRTDSTAATSPSTDYTIIFLRESIAVYHTVSTVSFLPAYSGACGAETRYKLLGHTAPNVLILDKKHECSLHSYQPALRPCNHCTP